MKTTLTLFSLILMGVALAIQPFTAAELAAAPTRSSVSRATTI
jgi:hypothetical protein